MEIQISKLKEHPQNTIFGCLPKSEFAALKADISKRGIQNDIDITSDNIIVCGHQRIKACKELGIETINARVLGDWSNEQIIEHLIKDNILRRQLTPFQIVEAGQELEKLYNNRVGGDRQSEEGKALRTNVRNALGETRNLVAKDFGISGRTYERYKKSYADIKETGDEELIEKEKKKEISLKEINLIKATKDKAAEQDERREKVKEIKLSELMEGDCLEQLNKLNDNSVHCLIIDPPYGIDFQSNRRTATPKHDKIDNDQSDFEQLLFDSLKIIKNKLVEGSHLYIFTSWKKYPEFFRIISNFFIVKNCLIWVKNNHSMGDLKGNYAEKHEMIIFATNGIGKPLVNKRPVNVIHCDRIISELHPTEKPVDLLKKLILNSTVEGELVLDCFAGSGSTGLACKETNRNFILIEKEQKYCDIITERLI